VDGGLVTMSARERDRLRVIEAVRERRLKQSQAAQRLGLSVRQIKRLVRAHRSEGARGLVSKRRGRPSNRRIGRAEQERVIATVREHYRDFGPTLASEYLEERHGFTRSVETLRQWMIQAEIWRPKRARHKRAFQLRERRAAVGELVQLDGSPHHWLEDRGPRCTLIAFIDDASGALQYARFVPAETTRAYLHGLRSYVQLFGRPVAFYSDRHSIFRKHDPEDPTPTQFERAVRALDIEPILALSPQAKGRVERAFQTLQDRLVKALRLAGVDSMEAANAFLPGFMARHNERFGQVPRDSTHAHRPLHQTTEQLLRITSEQHQRTLSKSLSCQYRGKLYLIQTGGRADYHLRGAKLTVCDDGYDESIVLLYQGKPLPYRVFVRHDLPDRIADDKTLDTMVEAAKRLQAAALRAAPSKSKKHPWRRAIRAQVDEAARTRAARSGRPSADS
jgi:transposase